MPCEVLNFSYLPCSRRLRLAAWRRMPRQFATASIQVPDASQLSIAFARSLLSRASSSPIPEG